MRRISVSQGIGRELAGKLETTERWKKQHNAEKRRKLPGKLLQLPGANSSPGSTGSFREKQQSRPEVLPVREVHSYCKLQKPHGILLSK